MPYADADKLGGTGVNNSNDNSMRNKRSVQVPNPENRVLFELTTISNEIGRDNMTTVQTTLIPNSNRSLKQLPAEESKPGTTTVEPEKPLRGFALHA